MKTVLITGASGNLGKSTVTKFLAANYSVLATHSPGKPSSLAPHPNLETIPLDLTDETAVSSTLEVLFVKHPTLDAALLLAGGFAGGNIQNTDGATLRKMYALNFETAFFIARPLLLHMQKQSAGGRIVLVGSRTALRSSDGKNALAYALSKSLLFNLAEYLNAEGAKQNVVTSVVVPSTIDTPDNRKAMPQADFSAWVSTEEIADTLLFIAETQALRDPVFKLYGKA
jgi:NAD(P)-dependent dehydrogenase (short-subunit alcohol dehydrogenase family)